MTHWVILRTSGRRTLQLAESLAADNIEAWTPAWVRRVPRRRDEESAPLLPTFVFARARHLIDLLETASDPSSQHPRFSVMRRSDQGIPLIEDGDLQGLRLSERKRIPAEKQRAYCRGEQVMLQDGAWGGMSGIVERDEGKFVLVTFGGLEAKIARFLIDPGEGMAA